MRSGNWTISYHIGREMVKLALTSLESLYGWWILSYKNQKKSNYNFFSIFSCSIVPTCTDKDIVDIPKFSMPSSFKKSLLGSNDGQGWKHLNTSKSFDNHPLLNINLEKKIGTYSLNKQLTKWCIWYLCKWISMY